MYSDHWDYQLLSSKASGFLSLMEEAEQLGWLQLGDDLILPTSPNWEIADQLMVIASGYPESAGVWSYTLLLESQNYPESLPYAAMSTELIELNKQGIGWIVLDPHGSKPVAPENSVEPYYPQLHAVLQTIQEVNPDARLMLNGFSLGAAAILNHLHTHPDQIPWVEKLVLIDPAPPQLGRRKLHNALHPLMDQCLFFGMQDELGQLSQFTEVTKMRIKIKPKLITAAHHGEMPKRVWQEVIEAIKQS